jgi:hypothetical protein
VTKSNPLGNVNRDLAVTQNRAPDNASLPVSFLFENEMSAEFQDAEDGKRRACFERSAVEDKNALIQAVDDARTELERLETAWIQALSIEEKKIIKVQKWKADRHLDECNRQLEHFHSKIQLGVLASKISSIERDVSDVKSWQTNLEQRQDSLEKKVEGETAARCRLESQVAQIAANQSILQQEHSALRMTVDAIDNRVRLQSLVFHGIDTSNSYAWLAKFLPATCLDAIDTINEIGLPNEHGVRTSILVWFVTIRDCQRAKDFLRSDEFCGSVHAGTSWHNDSSELQRVGRTRMIAAGNALSQRFPGIELRATFVRYPPGSGVKHMAQEFAASHISIDNILFNIEAAVQANPDYVPNPAAKVTHGGRTYNGQRLKNSGTERGNRSRRRRGPGSHSNAPPIYLR